MMSLISALLPIVLQHQGLLYCSSRIIFMRKFDGNVQYKPEIQCKNYRAHRDNLPGSTSLLHELHLTILNSSKTQYQDQQVAWLSSESSVGAAIVGAECSFERNIVHNKEELKTKLKEIPQESDTFNFEKPKWKEIYYVEKFLAKPLEDVESYEETFGNYKLNFTITQTDHLSVISG
ncbi:5'-3' exoribonuclease 3 [Tanacetum coccineum]